MKPQTSKVKTTKNPPFHHVQCSICGIYAEGAIQSKESLNSESSTSVAGGILAVTLCLRLRNGGEQVFLKLSGKMEDYTVHTTQRVKKEIVNKESTAERGKLDA